MRLALQGKYEIGAIANIDSRKALLTPSYDGACKILISIIYEDKRGGTRYIGVVYNTSDNSTNEISIAKLWDQFNYTYSMPCGMSEISRVTYCINILAK
jgi:hypothetical protein